VVCECSSCQSFRACRSSPGHTASQGPECAAANLEEKLKNNPDVNQIIGPNGGWNKDGRQWRPIRDAKLLKEHKDHYHINVFRK